jgi:hypothetical protein
MPGVKTARPMKLIKKSVKMGCLRGLRTLGLAVLLSGGSASLQAGVFPGYGLEVAPGNSELRLRELFFNGNYRELEGLPRAVGCDRAGLSSDFSRIIRGGAPRNEESIAYLKARGVVAILDLRTLGEVRRDGEPSWAEGLGVEYVSVPLTTTQHYSPQSCTPRETQLGLDTERAVLEAVSQLQRILAANPQGKVYVHCARGQDRTGIVLGIARRQLDGCPLRSVSQEMAAYFYTPYCNLNAAWARLTR